MKAIVCKYKIVHDLSSVMTIRDGFESYIQSINVATGERKFVCYLSDIDKHPYVKSILSKRYKFN